MIPLETRLSNFVASLRFIADTRLQYAVWVEGKRGLSAAISLDELYSQFFDDNEIDDFIEHELPTAPIPPDLRAKLVSFRNEFDRVYEIFRSPSSKGETTAASILADPEWGRLVHLAACTRKHFEAAGWGS